MIPSCCVGCHFSWEQKNAFPYLPPEIQIELTQQHDFLRLLNFGKNFRDVLKNHSEQEMYFYKKYCPPEIIEQIELDHVAEFLNL